MAFESSVSQVVVGGDTVIRLQWRDTQGGGIPTFAARNFGIEDATLCEFTSDWEVNDVAGRSRAEWGIYRSETGDGIVVAIEHAGAVWSLGIGTTGSWAQQGSFIDGTTVAGLAVNTFWRMHIKAEVKEDDSTTVTATVRDLSDNDLGTLTATVNVPRGPYCGFHSCFDQLGSASTFDVKNIRVQASGATGFVPKLTSTAYVYTFVNNRGWESVPSLPTANVLRPDGVQVTVTTSTTAPVGYPAVTLKRIYRVVQALTGDLFLLVAEIPLAQADFVDNLADNEVGPDELLSQNFDLPPDGLRGIMALPSGAYCGFVGKQLCISAAGWPHAWPLQQRHSCEFNIVAIGKVGNTIVVGTEGRAYTCTGTDPGSYVMSEPGESQACVSKRSMVYLDGQGVAFASPDGYQLCAGSAGNLRNLTENVFTKRQWRETNPSSIIAAVHDGVLHWWWETEEAPSAADWLVYSVGSSTTPCARAFGTYEVLGTTIPWEEGLSASYATSANVASNLVYVPVNGPAEAPVIIEGVNWYPSIGGEPAPTFSALDPSDGIWSGYTWVITCNMDFGDGGGLLFLEGESGFTTITFLPGEFYSGASYAYEPN